MIKFGVAGNSKSFFDEGYTTTSQAASWCAARGIDVFEYSFGRGVTLPTATAEKIGEEFKANGVELTVHAPYFINFSNTDAEKIENSINYIMQSVRRAVAFNGNRVVVHPACQGKLSREEAFDIATANFKILAERIEETEGFPSDMKLCLETMGKLGQMGTVDEIISWCNLSDKFYPCIDFGHVNAREQGILKTALNYNTLLQKMEENLPKCKVFNMHVHFSKIKYGAKGELCHLTFEDKEYGPEFPPLAEVLVERGLEPYIICESDGTQAEDAMFMKRCYLETLSKASGK